MKLLEGRLGLVGATGVVGRELLALLEQRGHSPATCRLMASAASAGRTARFGGKDHPLLEATAAACCDLDLIFFCAGAEISQALAPAAAAAGAVVIDNSSAFRMDPQVPLVVPEINGQTLRDHRNLIANPNCSTIILLMALAPLHRRWRARRVVVSTYQAASGAGQAAMEELQQQARDVLAGKPVQPRVFKHPIAFNLFSHDSDVGSDGYCGEETKMIQESRKILASPEMEIVPTTIRVPVLRAHSEAVTVVFAEPPDEEEARHLLAKAPGVTLVDDRATNHFPMPLEASGRDVVYVGRLRRDTPNGSGLSFFVCGDQIRKGAALNALQIAEAL